MIRSAPYLHDPTRYFAQLGPGHTDKRIRFCDKILCRVLRYSFAESLSRGHTAIVNIGGVSRSERGLMLTALSQVSAWPHGAQNLVAKADALVSVTGPLANGGMIWHGGMQDDLFRDTGLVMVARSRRSRSTKKENAGALSEGDSG